eukprot:8410287-Pyramimonas_sp.AAC.1
MVNSTASVSTPGVVVLRLRRIAIIASGPLVFQDYRARIVYTGAAARNRALAHCDEKESGSGPR